MPEVLVRRRKRARKRGLKSKLNDIYSRNRSAIVVVVAIAVTAVLGFGALAFSQQLFDNPRPAGGSSLGIAAHSQNP